ncbi:LLM class flavin-dependent oxidoreductase [Nonomuraea wenchangensis]|uniref:LLM class flavin-dependent oxidoreductase n=1 Tax=Nonomuraea wenchangensis TaxID=568860 RepID=UPI003445BADA
MGPAQLWWGDKVDHDDRYARTSEFLDVLKGVWRGGHTHHGRFYQVENAGLPEELRGQPFPEIFFSGSSPAAIDAAGRHADYYLSWLEPFEALAEKWDAVRAHSRTPPRFAVRVDLLARESEQEAWAEIEEGWRARPGGSVVAEGDSVGVRRSRAFLADGRVAHPYARGDRRPVQLARPPPCSTATSTPGSTRCAPARGACTRSARSSSPSSSTPQTSSTPTGSSSGRSRSRTRCFPRSASWWRASGELWLNG